MEEFLSKVVGEFAAAHPWVTSVFLLIGILRAINKPLFAALHEYVLSTPSTTDDSILDKVESSPVMKAIRFVLDWTASIKLPVKKTDA